MKKMLSIVLILSLFISLGVKAENLSCSERATGYTTVWSDDFEEYDIGRYETKISKNSSMMWKATTSSKPYETFSIENSPVQSDGRGKVLSFEGRRSESGGVVSFSGGNNIEFQTQSKFEEEKYIKISFDLYMETARYTQLRLFGVGGTSYWNAFTVATNGNIAVGSGNIGSVFPAGGWHSVDLFLNFNDYLCDVYLDGEAVKQNAEIKDISGVSYGRMTVAKADPLIPAYIDDFDIAVLDEFCFDDASVVNGYDKVSVLKKEILLNFSQPVDEGTLEGISVKKAGEAFSEYTVSANEKTITLTFDNKLDFGTEYKILANGVKDIYGQELANGELLKFTTISMGLAVGDLEITDLGSDNFSVSIDAENPTEEEIQFDLYFVKYASDGSISAGGVTKTSCVLQSGETTGEEPFTAQIYSSEAGEKIVAFVCSTGSYPSLITENAVNYNDSVSRPVDAGAMKASVDEFTIEPGVKDTIKISGSIEGEKRKNVLIYVSDSNGGTSMIVPVYTNAKGNFEYSYPLSKESPDGMYYLSINGEKSGEVFYMKEKTRNSVVESINNATKENYETNVVDMLNANKDILLKANPNLSESVFSKDNYQILFEQKPYTDYPALKDMLTKIDNIGKNASIADWVKIKELAETEKNIIFANDITLLDKVIALNDNSIFMTMVKKELNTPLRIREAMKTAYDNYTPPKKENGGNSPSGYTASPSSFDPEKNTNNMNVPIKENKDFNDLGYVPWAQESISILAKKNIVSGDGNGNFRPMDSILREEFVTMLCKAFNLAMNNDVVPVFSDVNENEWYNNNIRIALQHGLIFGKDDGSFGIGDVITREDMSVMIYRILCKYDESILENISLNFADADVFSDYAKQSVASLYNAGIVSGMGNEMFCPKLTATRAQAAQIIYNVIKYTEQ